MAAADALPARGHVHRCCSCSPGAALLALTYTLAAHVLAPAPSDTVKQLPPRTQELLGLCKRAGAPGQPPMSASMLERCNRALVAAGAGAYDRREGTLRALKGASLIALGVLAIAAAGLGWLVAGRALRPVRSITEAARRASELRLGQRLALTGPDDELKQLADTFDVMLERLDAAFTSQKQFVANAAHELRTPLTAMRTAIEVTLSKPTRTPEQLEAMAARVKRSVERAEATVEALLALATSQLGPVAHEAIDLATAAEDALDATHAAIAQREIEVDAALEPALAQGDRVLLERMIANLVENAAAPQPRGRLDRSPHGAAQRRSRCSRSPTRAPTCRPSRSRPCSSPSPAPSSASTPPTASGSASRSPTRSPARTTPRSTLAQDRAAGSRSRSRSRRARAQSQGRPPLVRAADSAASCTQTQPRAPRGAYRDGIYASDARLTRRREAAGRRAWSGQVRWPGLPAVMAW